MLMFCDNSNTRLITSDDHSDLASDPLDLVVYRDQILPDGDIAVLEGDQAHVKHSKHTYEEFLEDFTRACFEEYPA